MNIPISLETITQITGVAAAFGFGYLLTLMVRSQVSSQKKILALAEGLITKQDELHVKEMKSLEKNHEREKALITQDFHDDLEDLKGKVKSQEEQIEALQAVKDEQATQIADLKRLVEERGRQIAGLERELAERDLKIADLIKQLGEQKAANVKAEGELKELRVRIRALEPKEEKKSE